MDILADFEEWFLIKNGIERPTACEMDSKTLRTLHRFTGFEIGQKLKERIEQEREIRKTKMRG